MTEPVDVLVLNALMAQLTSPALLSPVTPFAALPVASPSTTYTPTAGKAYLDARNILRAEPDRPGMSFTAAKASTFNRGIFQVDAVGPDGAGEAALLRIAALVAARFPIGLVLPAAPYQLQFQKLPVIAAAVKDAPWVRFPVSISYLIIT
jgi:hypothetical protein